MGIAYDGFNRLSGLSTDTKPVNVLAGFIFFETDTLATFIFDGTSWNQLAGGGGSGESNTASNGGAGGVGIVLTKVGVDLPFKSINVGSSKVTVTNDAGNKEIDIDIVEANINVGSLTGTLAIAHGGTGTTTATGAFDALSPLTTLGDLIYSNGSTGLRLTGNITTTKKFLRQTGNGSVSAAPAWDTIAITDLPAATTTTAGIVELATDGETSNVVQGNDARLSNARTPSAHKTSHVTGGSDAFIKTDVLIAATRYIETVSDPTSDAGRIWVSSATLKFWGNEGSPVKHSVEDQANRGVASGYADLDSGGLIPLSRISNLVDANIDTHTSTKISITSKSLLNNTIFYKDQNNSIGSFYADIANIAVPANPASGTRRLFVDTADNKLKVRTSSGTTISLEEGGEASGEANTASNVGVAGIGVFKQKTLVDLEFKNINSSSNKISVTDDTGNNEIDLDIVEANLTLTNLGGTLSIAKGGTGQTTALAAFNGLSPLTTLGDTLYNDGTDDKRLGGNTTSTRKFLRQLGDGVNSAAPAWDTIAIGDLPVATTSALGIVELATDGETASSVVVQGNDARLSNARTPTSHKASHVSGGGDAFVKTDILIATSRYIEVTSDPTSDIGRFWIVGADIKYWDNTGTPIKQTVQILANKGVADGYCDLDGSTKVPLSRLASTVPLTNAVNVFSVGQKFDSYFDMKVISTPGNPASGYSRFAIEVIDANNDGLFAYMKKAGGFVKVQVA